MGKLKQDILDKIKQDPDLFAEVAKALKIKPTSLPNTLNRNSSTLNDYEIVKLIAKQLNMVPEDVLEDEKSEVKESAK